jgi:hypothetical protein
MSVSIATVLEPKRAGEGQPVRKIVDVTLDNTYPGGGYPLTAAMFGMRRLDNVVPQPVAAGYAIAFNPATSKLMVYWTGAGLSAVLAEVTGPPALAAVVVRCEVVGG